MAIIRFAVSLFLEFNGKWLVCNYPFFELKILFGQTNAFHPYFTLNLRNETKSIKFIPYKLKLLKWTDYVSAGIYHFGLTYARARIRLVIPSLFFILLHQNESNKAPDFISRSFPNRK